MTRMTFEVIFGNEKSEIAEVSEWNNEVKFSKTMCKQVLKDAIWFFRMYNNVTTVNCYLDSKESKQMRCGKNIAVSVERMADFYMVYMKNPNGYNYQMTRSFFIKGQ